MFSSQVQIATNPGTYRQQEEAITPDAAGEEEPEGQPEGNSGGVTGRGGSNTSAARKQRRAKKSLTLQQQKHYVTTIFFFVSVLFLAVSLPSSISHLVNHLFNNILPGTFIFNLYLLTETLYGVNFILNPYLFSFNNSYLKQRRAEFCDK